MDDEGVRVCHARGALHLLVGGIQPAVADVLAHALGEEVGILQHHAHSSAQRVARNGFDGLAVNENPAAVLVVEARQQRDDGGLSRARGADNGDLLALFRGDGGVLEHRLAGNVGEGDVADLDVALDVGDIFGLGRILLRLLVHHLEHALRARQRRLDGVEQVCDLRDGAREVLHVEQEGEDHAHGNGARDGVDDQISTCHRNDQVGDVVDHVHKRAHHAGDDLGLGAAQPQPVVDVGKVLLVGLLAREELDDLLTGNHLLDVAIEFAQILLLLAVEAPRDAGYGARDEQHHGDGDQRDERQQRAEHEHGNQRAHDVDDARKQLRDGLGQGV